MRPTLAPFRPALAALALLAGLAGCSMAPVYERPPAPIATQWPGAEAADGAGQTRAVADIGWREFFRDPRLARLVELGLANNRDLRVAVLNIEAARAQYGITRADQLPTVGAGGSVSRQRVPADLSPTGQSGISDQYQATLGVTAFEIDLFGRVRNLGDAALAQFLSTGEARKAMQISLVAQIADAYLTERAADQRIELLQRTLGSREESLKLVTVRYEGGAASELEQRQAQGLVAGARADLADARRLRAQAANALTLLIGQPLPADLPAPLTLDQQGLISELPAGLPSQLIERRPDIAAAEQQLRGSYANIGAARAAFFPRITLTGALGTASSELDGLFGRGSGIWSFMPQISLPIFDAGRNQANLDLATVRRDIAVARYEQTIQSAFREVSDALAARGTLDEQLQAQQAQLEAAQRTVELSDLRYRSGVDNYLQLLDAQRGLYAAEQALLATRLARLSNLVALYKSLGGGWNEGSGSTS
ncbi:MAG: AdeC/AdeK/OprM family multidrug efflux complex outer membrane factor [Burkholderiaceae bacterium]